MRITFSLIAILMLFMLSCKERLLNDSKQDGINDRYASKGYDIAYGFTNPYELIGIKHNLLLTAGWQYIQESRDTTVEGGKKFLLQYFKGKESIDFNPHLEVLHKRSVEIKDPMAFMEESKFSPNAKSYFRSIYNAIQCIKPGNTTFEKQMLEIEEKAGRSDLPESERNGILQAAVIARYSGQYWQSVFTLTNTDVKTHSRSFFGKIVDVIAPTQADFFGALEAIIFGDSIMDIYRNAAGTSFLMRYYISDWIH